MTKKEKMSLNNLPLQLTNCTHFVATENNFVTSFKESYDGKYLK